MITLPEKIESEILKLLNQSGSGSWVKNAASLSLKYRTERSGNAKYIQSMGDVLAYLAVRSPSTYSQIYGALTNVKELIPDFKPLSILDIGSGPGTAIWAAQEIFPSIKTGTAIDMDSNFIKVGEQIISAKPELKINWQTANLGMSLSKFSGNFDLVIIGNVLNELDKKTAEKVLEFAVKCSRGIILITEPGTPYGYENIEYAAKVLVSPDNYLVAPYIDYKFINSDEINFAEKIKRPEFLKRVRHLQRKNEQSESDRLLPPSDWEESKYYYLAYSRTALSDRPKVRVIDKPKPLKPFVELKLLTGQGVRIERVFKKDRAKYKEAKKLKWGDIINSYFEKVV